MSALQVGPVPPATFDSTQGQIDALLAAVVSIIQVVPEALKPALRHALENNQRVSRDSAMAMSHYSDDYLVGQDRMAAAVWQLGLLGKPPTPSQ